MVEKRWRTKEIRVLPFKDSVIFPHTVMPLFSKETEEYEVEANVSVGQFVFLTLQKKQGKCESLEELEAVGVVTQILQVLKLSEGGFKILIEGLYRGRIKHLYKEGKLLMGKVTPLKDFYLEEDLSLAAMARALLKSFSEFAKLTTLGAAAVDFTSLTNVNTPGKIADGVASYLTTLSLAHKQDLLETLDVKERVTRVLSYLTYELELLRVEAKIEKKVKEQMSTSQKEFYLNERLKAVRSELDALGSKRAQDLNPELEELRHNLSKLELSEEAQEKVEAELKRLATMPPFAAEATVSRNYLEWLSNLPWKRVTEINSSLKEAADILEADHYGLPKVKERILEYLAVQSRMNKVKGPILCLVGPPGVGKTSLGRSMARATGRQFVRLSLGGISDEAEIRGHRRTYVGAMPGKIIQHIAKCKVNNPLFMLDEIDKMTENFHGDPASALLEVLDPEQNNSFIDHFLEVEYDLSDVMFIATANTLELPYALLDRMEILRLEGYTEEEKVQIAEKYLIPKQIKDNGLQAGEITFTTAAVVEIIRSYTREAGVRGLERAIAKICRKVLTRILKGELKSIELSDKELEDYLGIVKYSFGKPKVEASIGEVNGLAWTESGGDLLQIQVVLMPGKGKTTYTGQLGEVMQESVQAAVTVARSLQKDLALKSNFYETTDIHLHVPDGATPKDGPSAGITMCTALVSALTKIPARADVAMTGELTLSGEVLPIGGLKEKLLAALRRNIKKVFIPEENVRELKELPANVTTGLEIVAVKHIREVLADALVDSPFKGIKVKKKATSEVRVNA